MAVTIIDKIKNLLDDNNSISYNELMTFVEKESNHTLGSIQCLEDVLCDKCFILKSDYLNLSCTILVYINVDRTKNYELDTKIRVKNIVIVIN